MWEGYGLIMSIMRHGTMDMEQVFGLHRSGELY
jgi:hypothetical protein